MNLCMMRVAPPLFLNLEARSTMGQFAPTELRVYPEEYCHSFAYSALVARHPLLSDTPSSGTQCCV